MNLYSIPPIISSMLFLSLGILVITKSKASKQTTLGFSLFCLFTFLWQFFYAWFYNVSEINAAILLMKCGYSGVIFIPAAFFHFFANFTQNKIFRKIVPLFYAVGLGFLFLLWFSNLYINGMQKLFFSYYPRVGKYHYLYLIYLFIAFLGCLYCLIARGRKEKWKGAYGEQIKLLIVGLVIYTFASTDFLVDYGIAYYPMGYLSALICLSLCFYVIIRHQFMDIRLIFTKATIFLFLYTAILGLPLLIGYYFKKIYCSIWMILVLATLGPYLYSYLSSKAEEKILQEEKRYQEILKQLYKELNTIKDIHALNDFLVKKISSEMSLDYLFLYSHNPIENNFILSKEIKIEPLGCKEKISEVDPLVYHLSKEKSILCTDVIRQDFRSGRADHFSLLLDTLSVLHAELIVPIVGEKELLAFLVLGPKKDNSIYSKEDIVVLNLLAEQVGLAMENCLYIENLFKK